MLPAMVVSFLSAAFSSFKVFSSALATSLWPSRLAQAIREPAARDLVVIHGLAGHDERLEQVFQMLGKKDASVDCPAIDGIIDEAEDGCGDVEDKDLLDAAIWRRGQSVRSKEAR